MELQSIGLFGKVISSRKNRVKIVGIAHKHGWFWRKEENGRVDGHPPATKVSIFNAEIGWTATRTCLRTTTTQGKINENMIIQ